MSLVNAMSAMSVLMQFISIIFHKSVSHSHNHQHHLRGPINIIQICPFVCMYSPKSYNSMVSTNLDKLFFLPKGRQSV